MIKVVKNASFSGYYEIYDGLYVVEEIQGRTKAKRVALKLAKEKKEAFISFLGEMMDVA